MKEIYNTHDAIKFTNIINKHGAIQYLRFDAMKSLANELEKNTNFRKLEIHHDYLYEDGLRNAQDNEDYYRDFKDDEIKIRSAAGLILHQRPSKFEPRIIGAVALAVGIARNKSLLKLKLTHEIPDQEIKIIAQGVALNKTIKEFDFSNHRYRHDSEEFIEKPKNDNTIGNAFGRMLTTNESLVKLNLTNCQLGNKGAISIAAGLKKNKSLMILDLTDNDITDKGAGEILKALRSNSTITSIEFGESIISPYLKKEINEILDNNKASYENKFVKALADIHNGKKQITFELYNTWKDPRYSYRIQYHMNKHYPEINLEKLDKSIEALVETKWQKIYAENKPNNAENEIQPIAMDTHKYTDKEIFLFVSEAVKKSYSNSSKNKMSINKEDKNRLTHDLTQGLIKKYNLQDNSQLEDVLNSENIDKLANIIKSKENIQKDTSWSTFVTSILKIFLLDFKSITQGVAKVSTKDLHTVTNDFVSNIKKPNTNRSV